MSAPPIAETQPITAQGAVREPREPQPPRRVRQATATTNFGSGKREAHDATAFYQRFTAPELSDDDTIAPPNELDRIYVADARDMAMVASNSVALVVTSPPYFAGKQYEEALGEHGIPATYIEYLDLLRDVFAECKRVLEPGGRIAVNVANLGRKPYRSLSGDVTTILQDLGLLLRGEVIWWKGKAAGGSCAWGSFQSPSNPVLRDVTERVIIAGKGRFLRAHNPRERARLGLPSTITISREEFMEATTDLWEIAPESAKRVGHPAPFPVELPERLIHMHTFEGDLVLDPFMGSGSTGVAAVRTGRHYLGFDTDPAYANAAESRITIARTAATHSIAVPGSSFTNAVHVTPLVESKRRGEAVAPLSTEASRIGGKMAKEIAAALLREAGFTNLREDHRPRATVITPSFTATDTSGRDWAFDVSGAITTTPAGLRRTDVLFKAVGRASVFATQQGADGVRFVLLSTDLPVKGSEGAKALKAMQGPGLPVFVTLNLHDPDTPAYLAALHTTTPSRHRR